MKTGSPTRKLEILYYTPYFTQTLSDAIGFSPSLAEDLCTVTLDHNRLVQADAVVFHMPNVTRLPVKKPGQIWVGMSMESDANYRAQADPHFMRHFEIRMNFRRTAEIPLLYFDAHHHLPVLQTPPKAKTLEAPAVYFASNDYAKNGRYELVAELMEHMKVDSYGRSQNNCRVTSDTGRMTKLEVLAGYHFYLAFENSSCMDYVSEKVFDGLIAGTVPVYLGAPNIDRYLPGRKCIIKATDFGSGAALADFLLELAQDEREYQSYLAWKEEPLLESFMTLIEPEYTPALRRLCYKLLELCAEQTPKGPHKAEPLTLGADT